MVDIRFAAASHHGHEQKQGKCSLLCSVSAGKSTVHPVHTEPFHVRVGAISCSHSTMMKKSVPKCRHALHDGPVYSKVISNSSV
jgi:hypothetical protein